MRVYEYLQGILGALGVGDDNGVPTPAWRIEEYLEAIYEAIKAGGGGGGGGGTDLTTFLAPQFSSSTSYSAGDYVVRSGALYKFTEDHAAGAWTGTDAEQTLTSVELEALYAALSTKANVDGSYASMTVGNAEQLVSTVGVEDKTPYLFRTTGGSADVGDRVKLSEITGGTVAWNQLYNRTDNLTQNGITFTNSNGRVSISGQASGNAFYTYAILGGVKAGHKYLLAGGNSDSLDNTPKMYAAFTDSSRYNLINGKTATIFSPSSDVEGSITVYAQSGWDADLNPRTFIPQFFDLTQMFGSTIADYLYTLESGTAGAGVAWFRKLFPKDYYAYDVGSLLSVKTSAHKEVGFNQWDEQWEAGGIHTDNGQNQAYANAIRSKNYIPIIPTMAYHYKTSAASAFAFFYDANKNYLGFNGGGIQNGTFTPATMARAGGGNFANAAYMRFRDDGGSTYANDICINLHWDGERDGEYEPYEANTYALDDVELRGIPKLDANNNLYYDGDTYEADGTVTRKYEIIDLGVQNWTLSVGGANIFTFTLSDRKYSSDIKAICSRYPFKGTVNQAVDVPNNGDKTCCFYYQSGQSYKNFYIYDTSYSTADAFKTAMNGVYLVYELATPTTESADPYQETQICNDFGTEEFVDSRTVPMPVGASALYQANLRAKLEMAPDSPDGDGDYIVRQTDGENTYVPLVIPTELPTNPSTDGTYSLKVTVSDGTATLSWVADA